MEHKSRYYPGLDMLKFISALIILFHHYYLNTGINELRIFAHGGIFVELFFMISGFFGGVKKEKSLRFTYIEYLLNVCRRFVPMAMLSVSIYAICGVTYYILIGEWYRDVAIDFWSLYNSLLLTFAGGAVGNISRGINNPIWYLCVLVICHTLLYFIHRLSNRYNVSRVYGYLLIVMVGVAATTYEINIPFCNPLVARGYYSFFVGAILAVMVENGLLNSKKPLVISILTILIYVTPKCIGWDFLYENWKLSMPFVLYPAIMMLGIYPIFDDVTSKAMRFLSGWSFEIYLWHGALLVIQGLLYAFGIVNYELKTFIVFSGVTTIVSLFMYIAIEKRLNIFVENWLKQIVRENG